MKKIFVSLLIVLALLTLVQFSPNAITPVSATPPSITSVTLTSPEPGSLPCFLLLPTCILTVTSIFLTGKVVASTPVALKDTQVEVFFAHSADAPGNYANSTDLCPAQNVTAAGTFSCFYQVGPLGAGLYTWNATATGRIGGTNMTTMVSSASTFTAGPILDSIPLVAGWNLISLPLVPYSTVTLFVLLGLVPHILAVWQYVPTNPPATRWVLNPASIHDGVGYWLLMTKPETLYVLGSDFAPPPATPPSYPLSVGWNLVGFTPEPIIQTENLCTAVACTAPAYLSSLGTNYDNAHVYVYVNSSASWSLNPTTISPGQGMWVYVTAAATLNP